MAEEFPSHFLVKFYFNDRAYYTFCESIVSFNESKLEAWGPRIEEIVASLKKSQDGRFSRTIKGVTEDPEVIVLPNPDDECGAYTMFSAKLQTGKVQTGKGGDGGGG